MKYQGEILKCIDEFKYVAMENLFMASITMTIQLLLHEHNQHQVFVEKSQSFATITVKQTIKLGHISPSVCNYKWLE